MPHWDLAIIGGGAAGLSAAAAATGLSTLLVDPMGGGELMNLGPLRGLDTEETGPDLAARLLGEAMDAGAELAIGEVQSLTQTPDGWRLATADETHIARAVILAVGLAHGTLGLPNEAEMEGRGLSHCAACDGPLFQGQAVAVAGTSRWARLEAEELTAFASHVTLIAPGEAPPPIENVAILRGRAIGLEGRDGLDAVLVQPDDGGPPIRVPAQGLFVQTGRRAALGFSPDGLRRDADGRAAVDASLATSLPALFAAGEARSGFESSLPAAIADGKRATASARHALTPG